MTKKRNLWLIGIISIIIGYFLGGIINFPNIRGNMCKGDVGKVELYAGKKADPDMTALVERLRNDTAFCNHTSRAFLALKERVDGAQELAERTTSMCSDVPDLQKMLDKVQVFQIKAYNAALALEKANAELAKVVNGENADMYEQASNNAYICYSRAAYCTNVGKDAYAAISSYLKDKNGPEADEMAQLAVDWSMYCIQDAVLNDSQEDIEYWSKTLADANGVMSESVANMETSLGMKLTDIKLDTKSTIRLLFKDSERLNFMLSDTYLKENMKNEERFGKFLYDELIGFLNEN